MSLRNSLTLTVLLIICSVVAIAQERRETVLSPNGEIVLTPEQEERGRRYTEMLKHPDFIKLKIAKQNSDHGNEAKKSIESYKEGSEISFEFLMTNTLTETFAASAGDVYEQTRLQLAKDGQILPYHDGKLSELEQLKGNPMTRINGRYVRLAPNETRSMGFINLSKWYAPLPPGVYELTIKSRLHWDGQWIKSAPIVFEVRP